MLPACLLAGPISTTAPRCNRRRCGSTLPRCFLRGIACNRVPRIRHAIPPLVRVCACVDRLLRAVDSELARQRAEPVLLLRRIRKPRGRLVVLARLREQEGDAFDRAHVADDCWHAWAGSGQPARAERRRGGARPRNGQGARSPSGARAVLPHRARRHLDPRHGAAVRSQREWRTAHHGLELQPLGSRRAEQRGLDARRGGRSRGRQRAADSGDPVRRAERPSLHPRGRQRHAQRQRHDDRDRVGRHAPQHGARAIPWRRCSRQRRRFAFDLQRHVGVA